MKQSSSRVVAVILAIIVIFIVVIASLISTGSPGTPSIMTSTESLAVLTFTSIPATSPATKTVVSAATSFSLIEIRDSKGISMMFVPAGEFPMGSDLNAALAECKKFREDCDEGWVINEVPIHIVYLDAYYIDKYEITNKQYSACVNVGVCDLPTESYSNTNTHYYGNTTFDNHPVIFVDWDRARRYCEWRGGQLPTEAQWEKAARGTDGLMYPWGESLDLNYANYSENSNNWANVDTTVVGNYIDGRSPYGVYDMAGNVFEWVADWYSDTYYLNSPSSNPKGPDTGQLRVLRGGSWFDNYKLRSANRDYSEPSDAYNGIGFRCARLIGGAATFSPTSIATATVSSLSPTITATLQVFVTSPILQTATSLPTDTAIVNTPQLSPTVQVSLIQSFPAPGSQAEGITSDGTNLWLTDNSGTIFKVAQSGTVLDSFSAPEVTPQGITWDGSSFWLFTTNQFFIYQFQIIGGNTQTISSFRSPAEVVGGGLTQDMAWDGDSLWYANQFKVYDLDTSGNILGSFTAPKNVAGLDWDGSNLWLAYNDFPNNSTLNIVNRTGQTLETYSSPIFQINGLAWADGYLWVLGMDSLGGSPTIYKLSISN